MEAIANGEGSPLESGVSFKPAHGARLVLVGVIAAFIVLGTTIALKTPAYESADEPGHVENIQTW
jgi:hypothetical protein